MSAVTWRQLGDLYAQAAVRAELRYRHCKELHSAYTKAYADTVADADALAKVDAASRAAGDLRRVKAGTDAAWARDEATMYAALAGMARGRNQDSVPVLGGGGE